MFFQELIWVTNCLNCILPLEKCLPNVIDDIGSNQSGNSPNLSVSEWVNNGIMHDDQNSDKSSSSQKHLLSTDNSLNMVNIFFFFQFCLNKLVRLRKTFLNRTQIQI